MTQNGKCRFAMIAPLYPKQRNHGIKNNFPQPYPGAWHKTTNNQPPVSHLHRFAKRVTIPRQRIITRTISSSIILRDSSVNYKYVVKASFFTLFEDQTGK